MRFGARELTSKKHLEVDIRMLVVGRLGSSLIGGIIEESLHDVDAEAHFQVHAQLCVALSCCLAAFHQGSGKWKSLYFNPYQRPLTLQQCFNIMQDSFGLVALSSPFALIQCVAFYLGPVRS